MERIKFTSYSSKSSRKVRIAVVGCLHGNLKEVYDAISANELNTGEKVDILLCCGDFESVRTKDDLRFKSCPEKYKHMGQFQYYFGSGTVAPYLTLFIGGNHEASNVLNENFYGGWICENIFYLGRAGVIKYKGIRIAGLSGIYKKFDYFKGHHEVDLIKDIKSIYHVREFEIAKMSNLGRVNTNRNHKLDILMTHDWPIGCVSRKDINKITKFKYHWKEELHTNTLGSPASGFLLKLLKPKYHLAGHMHYTYFNEIRHSDDSTTQFIALDKAGTKQKRHFLHIFDYQVDELVQDEEYLDDRIYFDPEWMAITKAFNPYIPVYSASYNFANLVNANNDDNAYRNYIRYWSNNSKDVITPDNDFYDKLNQYYQEFSLVKHVWSYDEIVGELQREKYVQLLGIEDYHKTKIKNNINKEVIVAKTKINTEEIEISFDF